MTEMQAEIRCKYGTFWTLLEIFLRFTFPYFKILSPFLRLLRQRICAPTDYDVFLFFFFSRNGFVGSSTHGCIARYSRKCYILPSGRFKLVVIFPSIFVFKSFPPKVEKSLKNTPHFCRVLGEPKVLKEKFDAIFASTRYVIRLCCASMDDNALGFGSATQRRWIQSENCKMSKSQI